MTLMPKHLRLVAPALIAVLGLLAVPAAHADDTITAGGVPLPTIKTYKGKHCVMPTPIMRRRHFEFILHQRKETMHEGIRTKKFLLTNCVDCHANPKTHSVLGKNGFCSDCHEYAAVHIDCFSCHSDKPEKLSADAVETAPLQSKVISTMGVKR
jgi:hypothetical protein